jgi:tetratricopeptide (TPR) repeat protein
VELREKAMGKYNIPNAISFSNLFKYLRYTNDFENSVKYHQKSTEIFSRFPSDHPNAWVLHLSNGIIFFQRKHFQMALAELELGLRIAERRYSSNHINFMKIKLQFAKLLKSMGQLERSLRILENLEVIISKNIKESAVAEKIEHETDDEKILVRKNILIEMKELY